ncbi:hypothetical protein [Rugamonas rivuli]|uniref:Uncharacterized protein n=1 Tax=Rugamonas rivuli TaxID=2743358 RepID=A0A843SFN2_9BURK|nr:hypothetical protein [Rugamonas rivuli]MQA21982.1 hypothetical protein [Rugamonas rivuli]
MELTEEMDQLLEQAESTVQRYLKTEPGFPVFALVMHNREEVVALVADGFDDLRTAIGGLLKQVLPMVAQGDVMATLICSSMPANPDADDGWQAAMFDIEDSRRNRAYVVMPYRKRDYGGCQYRPMEFSQGQSQIFSGN